jgi:hypothetical protein
LLLPWAEILIPWTERPLPWTKEIKKAIQPRSP